MPGYESDVITQREQFIADAADQVIVVTLGEIRAPDRALEDHITHPGHFLLRVKEYHMARGVPGAVYNLQGHCYPR